MVRVSKLPVDPGPAAWNEILPPQPVRPVLAGTHTADWVVVGAGFAGLSAARRIAELHPSDRVVVLEASRLAHGPAGRNSGFMIDLPHDLSSDDYGGDAENDRRQTRLNRAAIDYALLAKARWRMSDEAIVQSGKINGAMSDRGLANNHTYEQHLTRMDEPCELLDAQAMQKITGIDCYLGGLYTPGTVMLQPALYTRLLADGIEQDDVRIYEDSPAIEIKQSAAGWQVLTPEGCVASARVILTVNGHLQSFGYYQQHLIHVFTYGSMTRVLTRREIELLGGQPNWSLTPADPLGTTVRRISGIGGDRIIIRNRVTFSPSMQIDDKRLYAIKRDHNNSFRQRFAKLSGIEMEHCWGGRLCLSRNNVSICEELENGLYAACCQNGLGTARGTISGKLIVELASGVDSSLLQDQQVEAAPRKLPPRPLLDIGARLHLRWGEFTAGREL